MQWKEARDRNAVCNDYSRAGYFIETTNTSKWVVFLESGGLCYSADSCNRRFFKSEVRTEFASNDDELLYEFYPMFDLNETWTTLQNQNRSLSQRINPYMTSMGTYIRDNPDFTTVEGRDILDSNPVLNPIFHDFNRVIIPYCTSDLWLVEDNYVIDGVNLSSPDPQRQFLDNVYKPDSKTLQFTFRGRTVLKSVVHELIDDYDLSNATEILLAGSSAGGLGVVNIAKWITEQYVDTAPNISVLVDSAWFINFRGNINRRFNNNTEGGTYDQNSIDRVDTKLFDLIETIPQCAETTPTGVPCCILLECLLTNDTYFPVKQVPVMVVFSLYDIYLLADAIAQQVPPGGSITNGRPSFGTKFIFTISEYGGAMNESLIDTVSQVNNVSFIATQCFQHVYFGTSTLWGPDSILGDSSNEQISVSLGNFGGSFRHRIRSNVWREYSLRSSSLINSSFTSCERYQVHSMQDAINLWYMCRDRSTYEFRGTCYSVHCNNECPESVDLLLIEQEYYPDWAMAFIICIVVMLTLISILTKIAFYVWKVLLFRKQDQYLERVDKDEENFEAGVPKFPVCSLQDAVSVACLDLKYSVKLRKKAKDEKRDATSVSFAIAHRISVEEDDEPDYFEPSKHCSTVSLHSTKSNSGKPESGLLDNININTGLPEMSSKQEESMKFSKGRISRQNAEDRKDSLLCDSPLQTNKDLLFNDEVDFVATSRQDDTSCMPFRKETKNILNGLSMYFNPGELVGIMGPSGCGKTTFLDILAGRRRGGLVQGNIFVNGIPMDNVRDEYMSWTGYVLQLATPYYENLTVRENITLAAQIKLPRKMTWREKFERVEQVIDVTGLIHLADTVVGGLTGPGLSGGQKKRLTIALQLITMPKVIFLDEPTSGLDSTASVELLSHLNILADSNRTVVLTIHQPRLEIFHMFHKLVLLSNGLVAYHGVPQKAYAFFVEAALNSFISKNLAIPEIGDHNPADIIMDMLGKPTLRRAILHHYQNSAEPKLVKRAIKKARVKDKSITRLDSKLRLNGDELLTSLRIQENDFSRQEKASQFNRLAVLETRADLATDTIWKIYLPAIFFGYGCILGTVYFQQEQPIFMIAGFCVYSFANSLFMFPVMQNYFLKALKVYGFENTDGAGRASDIIIQAMARFTTLAIVPVVLCSGVLYLLSVYHKFWSLEVFLQLTVVAVALSQTWIALLSCILCALPSLAFRLSPIITSITGFTSGFFIPRDEIGWWYRWLFYINPNYYGFSASAHILLKDINSDCEKDDIVECFLNSGTYALKSFNFDDIRPYMHIAILLLMTVIFLFLAIFSNWVRHTNFFLKIKHKMKPNHYSDYNYMGDCDDDEEEEEETTNDTNKTCNTEIISTAPNNENRSRQNLLSSDVLGSVSFEADDDVFIESSVPPVDKKAEVKKKWIHFANRVLVASSSSEETVKFESSEDSQLGCKKDRQRRSKVQSIFLDNKEHIVFKPDVSTPESRFANLVANMMTNKKKDDAYTTPSTASSQPLAIAVNSLKERQQKFDWSIKVTQEAVKEKAEEFNSFEVDEDKEKKTFRDLTFSLTEKLEGERVVMSPTSCSDDDSPEALASKFASRSISSNEVRLPRVSVRRRQRQGSESNGIFQKFRDVARKTRLLSSSSSSSLPPLSKKLSSSSFDSVSLNGKRNLPPVSDSTDVALTEFSRMDSDSSIGGSSHDKPIPSSSSSLKLASKSKLENIQEVNEETDFSRIKVDVHEYTIPQHPATLHYN